MAQTRFDRLVTCLAVLVLAACAGAPPAGHEPPVRTMAAELRQLHRADLLPRFRPNERVAQISSYDTTGGNNDGFSGLYSFVRKEGDHLVLADLTGPGVVQRIWTPTPTERVVAFYFDGESEPRLRLRFIDLFSGEVEPFRRPIVGNEVGGYYAYLPIQYARSLKIVYEGQDIRFHQIQFRTYPDAEGVASFALPLAADAEEELGRAVEAWSQPGEPPFDREATPTSLTRFKAGPGGSAVLYSARGGGRIVGLEIERDPGAEPWGPGVVLQARFDGETAIRAPVNDFFGYAFGEPSARSVFLGSNGAHDYVWLPMPFDRSAVLELYAAQGSPVSGVARVYTAPEARHPDEEGRLYASWRRETEPATGEPYRILSARGRGHQVGTLLQAQGLNPGMTVFFEGDDVVRVDGELRMHGTGSEDAFNGGWYALLDRWDGDVSLPVHGSLTYSLPLSRTGGYRFFTTDKVSFDRSIDVTIEHGPEGNAIPVDYTSVAFFYGEAPPDDASDPGSFVATPRPPPEHVFYPQLMEFALGGGTTAGLIAGHVEMRSEGNGLLRLDLSELDAGRYRVLLSYRRDPDAPEFSIWRRQIQVSPWMDASARTDEAVDRADLGEVELTDQVRTLTIRTRGGGTFRFNRLILVEVESP